MNGGPGTNRFRLGPTAIRDADVRACLQKAILAEDPESFREILRRELPELATQHRLYVVLIMTPNGMVPVGVDENGKRLGSGAVIDAGTPVENLNLEFRDGQMVVITPEGEIWSTPIPEGFFQAPP